MMWYGRWTIIACSTVPGVNGCAPSRVNRGTCHASREPCSLSEARMMKLFADRIISCDHSLVDRVLLSEPTTPQPHRQPHSEAGL